MAYSDKVLDHYNHPRNVGSLDKTSPDVGTGLVGAPECGDVMKLQIRVNKETGVIEDAKFKTFGCVVSRTKLNATGKAVPVSSLQIGQEVIAWNGSQMVRNRIAEITKHVVAVSKLRVLVFVKESSRKGVKPLPLKLITTKDHVFWTTQQTPIEARELQIGDKLFEITEFELRKLNDPSKTEDVRKLLAEHMRWLNEEIIDPANRPQNRKGFHCREFEKAVDRLRALGKKNWKSRAYREAWTAGMAAIDWSKPTTVEQAFIELFDAAAVPLRYSAGRVWIQSSSGPVSPDFILPGKKKCVEVYTKALPSFMEDRSTNEWSDKRASVLKSAGYETLFLAIEDIENCLPRVQNFVHNGMTVVENRPVKHLNELRGCERSGKDVVVYDIRLEEGANVLFYSRVASHNCGSAIASSSLATEWIKGRTIDQALAIQNMDIVKELSLPPVKIHCSVLAEDAIRAAVADWKKKQSLLPPK